MRAIRAVRCATRIRGRIITAVCCLVALAAAGLSAAAAAEPRTSPQKTGMAKLMSFYNSRGLIGKDWWQAAVALSTVETYQQATGDTSYSYAIAGAFDHNAAHDFEDAYNDDTGWWGLAWLQAYTITHDQRYLAMAETDADYMHQSWGDTCGGGVWWSTARRYKNAIPNELFLELTAWLHNVIRGDTKYLSWAEDEWSWFSRSGLIDSQDLVNDGLNSQCANNGGLAWTYNQGVILAGLSELYLATGQASLLTQAEKIARAATSDLTSDGVLTEPCGNACGGPGTDAESFKGIFVSDLKVLARTARTSEFSSFFAAQARSIEASDTTAAHGFGLRWQGAVLDPTSYSQASAEDALVAVLP